MCNSKYDQNWWGNWDEYEHDEGLISSIYDNNNLDGNNDVDPDWKHTELSDSDKSDIESSQEREEANRGNLR